MRLYHGTTSNVRPYRGMCLTEDESDAREYGPKLAVVDLNLDGLRILDVGDRKSRWETGDYPGDRDLDEYAKRRVDVIRYWDQTPSGREIVTYRLVSGNAVSGAHLLGFRQNGLVSAAERFMRSRTRRNPPNIEADVDGFCVSIKSDGTPLSAWNEMAWIEALGRLGVADEDLASTMEQVASWGVDD